MGDYLSEPKKEKEIDEGENLSVKYLLLSKIFRLGLGHVACKAGGKIWKMHICAKLISEMIFQYLECLMAMEVGLYHYSNRARSRYLFKEAFYRNS